MTKKGKGVNVSKPHYTGSTSNVASKKSAVNDCPPPLVAAVTTPVPCSPPPGEIAKDFELLAFLICFITFHNITVHNGHWHSVNKEMLLISLTVLSYKPILSLTTLIKSGIMRGISNMLVKAVFGVIVGGTLYVILPQVLEPGTATIIPFVTLVFLMSDKPAAFTVPPIAKGVGAEEMRKHVDSLTTQLFKRLERVVVYFLCISFLGLYLPFLFDKPSTIAKGSSCVGTQRIAAIVHLAVLLISQVFTVDLVMGLHEASLSIGRWQTAVVSTGSNSNIPEWKEGTQYEEGSVVRHSDTTYLASSPTLTSAHPESNSQVLIYGFFCKPFRVLKILTLTEAVVVVALFYQCLSLHYYQQFLPTAFIIFLHLDTIFSLARTAKLIYTEKSKNN